MNRTARLARQTLTIARRDFTAIVFTPTFLIFLLAPLIMLSFGAIGGLGASSMADNAIGRLRIVAIANADDAAALKAADERLRRLFRSDEGAPPPLVLHPPTGDAETAARVMLADGGDVDVIAVMTGDLAAPVIYQNDAPRTAGYLATLADTVQRDRRLGTAPLSRARIEGVSQPTASRAGQQAAGFGVVFVIFFLTLLLAGQAVGMLAEERNSKVIEVLAAAVPLEAVFFGKLIGMFGVAILFIGFWAGLGFGGLSLLPAEMASGLTALHPAVGMPAFVLLFLAYFMLAFLLLGAVFLGVGAQAGTMREIQMLSLPITIFQVVMFGLSAAAASKPGTTLALVAEVFPFSSPFAMAARAAGQPELWPHLLAIAWQLLWLALTIVIGAKAFRRGVLQSGGGLRLLPRRAPPPPQDY